MPNIASRGRFQIPGINCRPLFGKIESEGKSCSFDPELITPEYVYRMWGGKFSIEEIENELTEFREKGVNQNQEKTGSKLMCQVFIKI